MAFQHKAVSASTAKYDAEQPYMPLGHVLFGLFAFLVCSSLPLRKIYGESQAICNLK